MKNWQVFLLASLLAADAGMWISSLVLIIAFWYYFRKDKITMKRRIYQALVLIVMIPSAIILAFLAFIFNEGDNL